MAAYLEPIQALKALEAAQSVELLITRTRFPPGKPNGVSLALMTRSRRPEAQVIFVARPETRDHAAGLGKFLAMPVTPTRVAEEVRRVLQARVDDRGDDA